MRDEVEGMLSPYRVLDITDEKGLLCGKLLGDLGADVIKVERPGGDPARMIGPFYHDEVHPEKSLFWWAFNTSKRGITLDIESDEEKETFKKLVKTSDFVIESFSPGYLDKLGLGYKELEKINPGIIMVSITPFGQTGPYKDYKAPDIVAWAMGGVMYQLGEADRPPVRISYHSQAHLHASGEAAVGAMLALHHREKSGQGQHVDVSIQAAVTRFAFGATLPWDMLRDIWRRGGEALRYQQNLNITRVWPCKDGYVYWMFFGGAQAHHNVPLVKWMESEGMADEYIRGFAWSSFDLRTATQDVLDRLGEPTARFFMTHTKSELLEGSVKHDVILFPISDVTDTVESVQLAARGYWIGLEHAELRASVTYPGAFIKAPESPVRISRRPPLIGEHNKEVNRELTTTGDLSSNSRRPRNQPVGGQVDRRPLEGVRLVDFTWFAAAPIATKTLCDHGAEVIRVEGKTRPDGQRWLPPHKDDIPGINRGGGFNQLNAGKLSVALNLTRPKAIEIVKRLVAKADVVVENFAGGAIERMGLGYEELKKVKPDIIMLSSCMQGQTGPHATHPGYGPHLTALSGFTEIAGWPDRQGANLGVYTDYIAPHFNALAILSALEYRRRTGKGQHIDMSQYETGLSFQSPVILDYMVNQRVARRMGNSHPYAAPHNAYRCRGDDRWCAIAVFTDAEWNNFVRLVGAPTWSKDPRFVTLEARKQNEGELDRLVEEWTVNHSAEDVMGLLQQGGVAAGVLQTGEDLLEYDPQLRHRNTFRELEHPEIGKYCAVTHAFKLSKTPCELRRAPLVGEHNEHVLKTMLGVSDEEIAELVIEGVIE